MSNLIGSSGSDYPTELYIHGRLTSATDLETIINWTAHPSELSELILKPEYYNELRIFKPVKITTNQIVGHLKKLYNQATCLGLCSWKDKASNVSSNKF